MQRMMLTLFPEQNILPSVSKVVSQPEEAYTPVHYPILHNLKPANLPDPTCSGYTERRPINPSRPMFQHPTTCPMFQTPVPTPVPAPSRIRSDLRSDPRHSI